MFHIRFKYKDQYTRGEWREQECYVTSVEECMRIYGLDVDCFDYEILSVERV